MLQLQIPSLLKFVNFQIFCLDKGLSINENYALQQRREKVRAGNHKTAEETNLCKILWS